ncbi:MAG: DNA polymerase III subunit gamma/tau [Candidatus Makana argininalis]
MVMRVQVPPWVLIIFNINILIHKYYFKNINFFKKFNKFDKMYKVLARKWRPKQFKDLIGQKHIMSAVFNSIKLGKIHHAYLFSGIRGIGKTTTARLLAKSLNCISGIKYNTCNVCNSCKEIAKGCCIDVIEFDAASKTKIEDIRDIIDNIQYLPSKRRFKIYIIDEVHMLSKYSFNAILKTLEEPPKYVKFILITTDPNKIPITVISRCLHFNLKSINIKNIYIHLSNILKKENINYEPLALKIISKFANGSIRDALSLVEQIIAIDNNKISLKSVKKILRILDLDHSISIIEYLFKNDLISLMKKIDQLNNLDIDWNNLIVDIMFLLNKIIFYKLIQTKEKQSSINLRLKNLAILISNYNLQLYYQIFLNGRKEINFAPNYKIGFEMIVFKIILFYSK